MLKTTLSLIASDLMLTIEGLVMVVDTVTCRPIGDTGGIAGYYTFPELQTF